MNERVPGKIAESVKLRLIEKLAEVLSNAWQEETKKVMPTRVKVLVETRDKNGELVQKWRNEHEVQPGDKEIFRQDILNTVFKNLHQYWKEENLATARVVVELILKATEEKRKLDDEFIEEAAAIVHAKWWERAKKAGYVPEHQDMEYDLLSEVEKEKDRLCVRRGIYLLD